MISSLLLLIIGACLGVGACWWSLSRPVAVQVALYPLQQVEPVRIQWWTPLEGTRDGVWHLWPVPDCPAPPPPAADAPTETVEGDA
jgi:hypothetical protein